LAVVSARAGTHLPGFAQSWLTSSFHGTRFAVMAFQIVSVILLLLCLAPLLSGGEIISQ
jgi:hypothetical protein